MAGFALKLLVRILNVLSFSGTQRLGKLVGDLAFLVGGRLKKTTLTNLRLCFPDLAQDGDQGRRPFELEAYRVFCR